MSLTLNMVGGGGGSLKATDALLRVQAPAGSTVTITKGTTTKTDLGHENADDHSVYDYYFIIHQSQFDSVNHWTVTATDGTYTATDTIIVDAADEFDLVLQYTLYFVQNGVIQGSNLVAIGKKTTSSGTATALAPTVTYDEGYITIGFAASSSSGHAGIAYFPSQVNLSNFSTLRVIGYTRNNTSNVDNSSINLWTEIGEYQADNRTVKQNTQNNNTSSYNTMDITIDVSELSGMQYIGFNSTQNSSGYTSIRLVNVYLEP